VTSTLYNISSCFVGDTPGFRGYDKAWFLSDVKVLLFDRLSYIEILNNDDNKLEDDVIDSWCSIFITNRFPYRFLLIVRVVSNVKYF
jgi:hypothetical protein